MNEVKPFNLKKHLIILSVFLLILNLIQSYFSPLIDDEAYYWMWSQNLDFGYYDHPPMVALWVKMGFSFFQNELGVRVLTAIFGSLSVFILGLIMKPENKKQFVLFSVLILSFVLFNLYQFITTPDSPLIFFTVLYLFVLERFLKSNSWTNTLFLGVCMALLIYSKYHGVLVIFFTLIPLVLTQIKNPKFYVAIFVGIILYLPHLFWQQQNDWISFRYHLFGRLQNEGFEIEFLLNYLLSIIYVGSPLLLFHLSKAIFKLKNADKFEQSLKCLCFGVLGFFLLSAFNRSTQPQWIVVAFIPLIIIGFKYYQHRTNQHKIITILGFIGFFLILLGRIDFMLPNAPLKTPYHGVKQFMQNAGKVNVGIPVFEKYQTTSLYNFYNYPEKEAINYETLANRKSQYNLWNSGEKMNNQNIIYFSKYANWPDSIVWKNNKNTAYHYRKVDSIQMMHRLEFEVINQTQKNDSVFLELKLSNHHQRKIELNKDSKIKISVNYSEGRHKTTYRKNLKIDSLRLKPNESKQISVVYKQTDKKGKHNAYIGVAPNGFPTKKQSEWFTVFVK